MRRCISPALAAVFLLSLAESVAAQTGTLPSPAQAESAAPPLDAINAMLDREKPDPARIRALRDLADAVPPATMRGDPLATLLIDRSRARSNLGRYTDAIADAEAAVRAGDSLGSQLSARIQLGTALINDGQASRAVSVLEDAERRADAPGGRGYLFAIRRWQTQALLARGATPSAEAAARRAATLLREAQKWPVFAQWAPSWRAFTLEAQGLLQRAAERHREAEATFREVEQLHRQAARAVPDQSADQRRGRLVLADYAAASAARSKAAQGRIAEAIADIRAALGRQLQVTGKYSMVVADLLGVLGRLTFDQARYDLALRYARAADDIFDALGVEDRVPRRAWIINQQARIALRTNDRAAAAAALDRFERAIADWTEERRNRALMGSVKIEHLLVAGRRSEALELGKRLVADADASLSKDSAAAMRQRLRYANTLRAAGNHEEAVRLFRQSQAQLFEHSANERDDLEVGGTEGQDYWRRYLVEGFVESLHALNASADEAFRAMDGVLAGSVARALAEASGRMALGDARLAPLARRAQDQRKEIGQLLAVVSSQQDLSAGERDEALIKISREKMQTLRADSTKLQQDIARRFPKYAELIDPKAPSVDQIRAVLRPNETYLGVFVGTRSTYLWAIPKQGAVAFQRVAVPRSEIAKLVARVRKAVEADAGDLLALPEFDIAASARLYELLLKPIETQIGAKGSLVIAANDSLSGFPFGVLTPRAQPAAADGATLFSGYREIPWLARTHTTTLTPSAAAFRSLRQLAPGPKTRKAFIGFGDPLFSLAEASDEPAEPTELAMRGVRGKAARFRSVAWRDTDSAAPGLAALQRLPDTAEELEIIAAALRVDPAQVLHLRKDANEATVRGIDLSTYRVVAFATHGLVPGELAGLDQPALALTAPEIAGIGGDGLLSMEKVLGLKLDADWVILSACNTGAAAGRGAEAASGLARAFFFAGTRSVLVTGWAVHSQSSRDLVGNMFRRQAADPSLSRAEALQGAMMQLVDEGGLSDADGKRVVSYAHPIFWAPFMIVGDGG